jgi:hypothetical protein
MNVTLALLEESAAGAYAQRLNENYFHQTASLAA